MSILPLDARRALRTAHLVHVAVVSARGPHVTPQVFVYAADHVWLVTAATSLKARAVRANPAVGLLVPGATGSAVIAGPGEVFAGDSAPAALHAALTAPELPYAAAVYALHNAPVLAGVAADVWAGVGPEPEARVVIRVRPTGGVVLGTAPVAWGVGHEQALLTVPPTPLRLQVGPVPLGLPAVASDLLVEDRDAVLALESRGIPVPIPARWAAAPRRVHVDGSAAALFGAADGARACLTLYESPGFRPAHARGVLLRGVLARRRLNVTSATWWLGYRAGTVPGAAAG